MASEQLVGDGGVFWGEIAPCEHVVQLYEHDAVLLDSLTGFVSGGLRAGDAVVIIATEAHRSALMNRLAEFPDFSSSALDSAVESDQLIILDAAEVLSRFMVNGWPDADKFRTIVSDLLRRARGTPTWQGETRRVRAFGEMVALMWARGQTAATVQLERLWHGLCHKEGFSLFCAYPKVGFTHDVSRGFAEIRAAHSRVIGAAP